ETGACRSRSGLCRRRVESPVSLRPRTGRKERLTGQLTADGTIVQDRRLYARQRPPLRNERGQTPGLLAVTLRCIPLLSGSTPLRKKPVVVPGTLIAKMVKQTVLLVGRLQPVRERLKHAASVPSSTRSVKGGVYPTQPRPKHGAALSSPECNPGVFSYRFYKGLGKRE